MTKTTIALLGLLAVLLLMIWRAYASFACAFLANCAGYS